MEAKFDVVGLIVDDMARSLAFYRRLGFDLPPEADSQPHVEAPLPGGMRLTWDTVETIHSFHPGWRPGEGRRISLAFRCENPAELDALYGDLVSSGYHGELAPWDAFWGQRYAVMHDPDGNGVDLYCPSKTA